MRTSTPNKLGVTLSRLGFGNMRLPTTPEGAIDRAKAGELIDFAYKNGVNYFDTAWPYHGGESELFIGEALSKYPRDSFYLADKLPVWQCKSKEDVIDVFHQQLEKCKVDHFDFYLLHALNKARWQKVLDLGILDVMRQLKDEGKIRFLGFSFHDNVENFPVIVDAHDWDFVQIQINYIDETLMQADTLYKKLCDKGIPAIVMEPVRGGFLASLPENAAEPLATCGAPSAKAWPTHAMWALRWCLGHDNMAVILSGMGTMEQVEQNCALFSDAPVLDEVETAALHASRDILLSTKTVPCTGCGYCKCPHGVYIPEIFDTYNKFQLFHNSLHSKMNYARLTRDHSAHACIACGACVPLCPQGIQIPGELQQVHTLFKEMDIPMQPDIPVI